jgi:hypothetical protein
LKDNIVAERKTGRISKIHEKSSGKYDTTSVKTSGQPAGFRGELSYLQETNNSLLARIKSLEDRLTLVETSIPNEKVIVLREISREDAKNEICSLFSKGATLYYSDIAERLNLDLQTVVDICNELQQDGEIKVNDDAL